MMEMQIKSFLETSLIDYDGKVSSVIFLPYCNFKCPYCHNKQLVLEPETLETIAQEKIFSYLKSRKDWIDAVVISGGEPTIHKDLPELCKKIKNLDFLVKLDTNGTNPQVLKELIAKNLVDYIAMDIKTSLKQERYEKVTGTKIDLKALEKIKESIAIIKTLKDSKSYEFRVTCVPNLVTKKDLLEIAQYLREQKANKILCLQQFQKQNLLDPNLYNTKPYTNAELNEFLEILKPYFEKIKIRGI